MRSRAIATATLVAVMFTVLACTGTTGSVGSQAPIRVGALFPQTGSLATLGIPSVQGAQLAVEMTNAQGGINGRKIDLILGDANSPSTAVSETTRLITQQNVSILEGTYASDLSLAASGAAARHDTFYWETDAIADTLTARGLKNFFQFPFLASDNGKTAVAVLKNLVLPKLEGVSTLRMVIVHNDSSYASLVAIGAELQARANGFQVLNNLSYPTQTNDMTSLVLQIKSAGPDVVIASSYANDAVLLLRGLQQQGVQLKAFVGTGGIYGLDSFGSALGSTADGLFDTEGSADVPTSALTDSAKKRGDEFRVKWQAKYAKAPDFLASVAFDATWVLLHEVIGKAKSPSPADLTAVAHSMNLPKGSTILGYGVKFDSKGLNELSFVVGKQWQGGKLPIVYPSDLASAQPINVPLPAWSSR